MKQHDLHAMTVESLVESFLANALEQYEAELIDAYAKYNRLFRRMRLLENELQSRPGDQRHALLPLCDHRNAHVRLRAAIATLAIAPEKARQTLQIIVDRNEYPDAADARGMLRALDQGTYTPT
jgi:hypothetical protein